MLEQTLGHYKVGSQLGSGGMGVVYQATDTRLGRQVAIKLLHDTKLNDPERLARFEREARMLASLSHPNIAAIHGLERAGDRAFLVLEYVPGDTLSQRLARGPLPCRDALNITRQVADALEAAHDAGIIHRDLKPSNIKITPEEKVKVLDFGLAKPHVRAAAVSASSTEETDTVVDVTGELSTPGMVMGTVAYMSPEQASGKPVDQRTDIWALGCVLYESLTGKLTFPGTNTTEVIVGILDRDPDWNALPATTPENIKCLIRRCLAKDPRLRIRHVADVRLELEETLAGRITGAVNVQQRRAFPTWAAATACIAGVTALAAAAWLWPRSSPTPPRLVRFSFDLPQGTQLRPTWDVHLTFSRDSKTLLYPVNSPPRGLHVRQLDRTETGPLEGGESFGLPLYSPDNRWIAVGDRTKRKLVKLPLSGGAPVPITDLDMPFRGDWSRDGYLYWNNELITGVIRTPENGGENQPVTQLDASRHEISHRYAKLLPGDNALLFTVVSTDIDSFNDARIDVFDLKSKKRKTIVHGGTSPRYSPSGHVVYASAGSLFAVPFDVSRLETTGTPVKVIDGVLMSTNIGTAYYDVSPAGDLAYAAGPAENGGRTLHWVSRDGSSQPVPLPPRSYLNPRLSPDGKFLAVEVEGPTHDFYIYDFGRAIMTRATNDGMSHAPIWSPDMRKIAFRTWKGGKMTLAWMPADRSGPAEGLLNFKAWQSAVSFSPDGRYLSFDQINPPNGSDVWVLPLSGERKPIPFSQSKASEASGKFSPDGKWIVFCSMESGKAEIYVQQWPGPGPKIQISSDGGTDPVWRRDGKEIFYRNGSQMMSVQVTTGDTLRAGKPQLLWTADYMHGLSSSCGFKGPGTTSYDVSADGQRLLMIKDQDASTFATKIVVVVNWAEELKQRVRGGS